MGESLLFQYVQTAVWGCGPVGQFPIRSALMLGAEKVSAIDHYPQRLDLARQGHPGQIHEDDDIAFLNIAILRGLISRRKDIRMNNTPTFSPAGIFNGPI